MGLQCKESKDFQLKPHGNQITRMAVQIQWVNLLASVQRFKQVHDFRLTIKALDPRQNIHNNIG